MDKHQVDRIEGIRTPSPLEQRNHVKTNRLDRRHDDEICDH